MSWQSHDFPQYPEAGAESTLLQTRQSFPLWLDYLMSLAATRARRASLGLSLADRASVASALLSSITRGVKTALRKVPKCQGQSFSVLWSTRLLEMRTPPAML